MLKSERRQKKLERKEKAGNTESAGLGLKRQKSAISINIAPAALEEPVPPKQEAPVVE